MGAIIRRCAPNPKMKSFGMALQEWQISEFDANGNAKAAELVRTAGKQRVYLVTVTGGIERNVLSVISR